MAAKAAGIESVDGRMTACDDESGWWKTTQQPISEGISKSGRWWAATVAMLRHDGNATATVIDGDGRCDGDVVTMTAIEGATATLR